MCIDVSTQQGKNPIPVSYTF